jgi:hypothetical protein
MLRQLQRQNCGEMTCREISNEIEATLHALVGRLISNSQTFWNNSTQVLMNSVHFNIALAKVTPAPIEMVSSPTDLCRIAYAMTCTEAVIGTFGWLV